MTPEKLAPVSVAFRKAVIFFENPSRMRVAPEKSALLRSAKRKAWFPVVLMVELEKLTPFMESLWPMLWPAKVRVMLLRSALSQTSLEGSERELLSHEFFPLALKSRMRGFRSLGVIVGFSV